MTNISTLLMASEQKLTNVSDTPRLDAELLLAHVLKVQRSYFYTHGNEVIAKHFLKDYDSLIDRRLTGEPIAYLLGHKEFWSLNFRVSKDTLIPRPETELLVQLILTLIPEKTGIKLADLGVGCGAIALAIALERPAWIIHGVEISKKALEVALTNLQHYKLKNVLFDLGNWCKGLREKDYQIIVANPPYIAEQDPHLQHLTFEPRAALVSGDDGLADIRKIIAESRDYLAKDGLLFIEHGFEQQQTVIALMLEFGFKEVQAYVDISGQPRVVMGQWQK